MWREGAVLQKMMDNAESEGEVRQKMIWAYMKGGVSKPPKNDDIIF